MTTTSRHMQRDLYSELARTKLSCAGLQTNYTEHNRISFCQILPSTTRCNGQASRNHNIRQYDHATFTLLHTRGMHIITFLYKNLKFVIQRRLSSTIVSGRSSTGRWWLGLMKSSVPERCFLWGFWRTFVVWWACGLGFVERGSRAWGRSHGGVGICKWTFFLCLQVFGVPFINFHLHLTNLKTRNSKSTSIQLHEQQIRNLQNTRWIPEK
jgi:hypothetical protein